MHFSTVFASTLAIAGLATAHSGREMSGPKIFGRSMAKELKERGLLREARSAAAQPAAQQKAPLESRQVGGTSGQCGKNVGSCAAGYCCSGAGWCGQGTDYCAAPDCQFNYGSGCDSNKVPSGASTSTVARPKVGSVPYGGVGIYDCTTPGMIAITYDDGPAQYTGHILDLHKQYNAPATFFITGNNLGKGEIDNPSLPWADLIRRMDAEGHQVASHTWSHLALGNGYATQNQDKLTKQQRLNQMYYNEMAFRNILGFFPTYMRPPYSDCDSASGCEADLATLGYHIIYFDLDTEDYLNDAPTLIQNAKNDFSNAVGATTPGSGANFLSISHDIHQQTAYNLTEFMLTYGQQRGWTFGTVGQCLGDPKANWYRGGSGTPTSSTSTRPTSTPTSSVSTDGTCGGTGGKTCLGSGYGDCCSQYGWCGSTTGHCGGGCQANFGTCSGGGGGGGNTVSPDGSCGGTNKYTCQGSGFGNCCSQYGWCGSAANYCGTGCQAGFGTCT